MDSFHLNVAPARVKKLFGDDYLETAGEINTQPGTVCNYCAGLPLYRGNEKIASLSFELNIFPRSSMPASVTK